MNKPPSRSRGGKVTTQELSERTDAANAARTGIGSDVASQV